MCTTCGCGSDEVRIEGASAPGSKGLPHSHEHSHTHAQEPTRSGLPSHIHPHPHPHPHSHAHAHAESPASGTASSERDAAQRRVVEVEQDLLARNDAHAAANRRALQERGIFALNLVSSPGSGKTTLLVRTATALKREAPVAVVEGDQQTNQDVERIRSAGVRGLQINTGKGCHLDAHMVAHALEALEPADGSLLFIENVGNLVCPAAFDLGEAHKVVIISTTEGEDKPIKYPDMFAASDLMLVNKIDLLPHLDFDVERCVEYARRVNPDIQVLLVSASTGEGMEAWHAWIRAGHERALARARLRSDAGEEAAC